MSVLIVSGVPANGDEVVVLNCPFIMRINPPIRTQNMRKLKLLNLEIILLLKAQVKR